MNSLVKAELKNPAWAFVGVCALQLFSTKQRESDPGFFPGGDHQLVIPGLVTADIFQL